MARIDVVKMFKETPAFIFKNLDIVGLYILATLPALATSSPLINLRDLPQHVYGALWIAMGIYGTLIGLTITAAILNRLKNKKLSPLGAFKHVWKQLFTKGAWWYLIFALCVYYGPTLGQVLLIGQPDSLRIALMVITFLLTVAAIYYSYIIVDDYRSLKDTVTKSLRYVQHSLVPFLKIMLFTLLVVAPISATIYFIATRAGFNPEAATDVAANSALMLAFTGVSFLVGFVYSIVFCKLYLQLKAQD